MKITQEVKNNISGYLHKIYELSTSSDNIQLVYPYAVEYVSSSSVSDSGTNIEDHSAEIRYINLSDTINEGMPLSDVLTITDSDDLSLIMVRVSDDINKQYLQILTNLILKHHQNLVRELLENKRVMNSIGWRGLDLNDSMRKVLFDRQLGFITAPAVDISDEIRGWFTKRGKQLPKEDVDTIGKNVIEILKGWIDIDETDEEELEGLKRDIEESILDGLDETNPTEFEIDMDAMVRAIEKLREQDDNFNEDD